MEPVADVDEGPKTPASLAREISSAGSTSDVSECAELQQAHTPVTMEYTCLSFELSIFGLEIALNHIT